MVRVVVPVVEENAENLSEYFGRAPFFALYEVSGDRVEEKGVFPNKSDHYGGSGHPPEKILELGAEAVISMGMGMHAIEAFQKENVAVLRSETSNTADALKMFTSGTLEELTEGCLHSYEH